MRDRLASDFFGTFSVTKSGRTGHTGPVSLYPTDRAWLYVTFRSYLNDHQFGDRDRMSPVNGCITAGDRDVIFILRERKTGLTWDAEE